jgi:hypothetical protein
MFKVLPRDHGSRGGGEVSSTTTSSQAVATACVKVAQKLFYQNTPAQPKKPPLLPPLFEVSNHSGINTSPMEYTLLTPAMTTNNPTATSPSFAGFLEGLDDDAYHNALAD